MTMTPEEAVVGMITAIVYDEEDLIAAAEEIAEAITECEEALSTALRVGAVLVHAWSSQSGTPPGIILSELAKSLERNS